MSVLQDTVSFVCPNDHCVVGPSGGEMLPVLRVAHCIYLQWREQSDECICCVRRASARNFVMSEKDAKNTRHEDVNSVTLLPICGVHDTSAMKPMECVAGIMDQNGMLPERNAASSRK